jgi:hypothetical protein
VEEGVGGGATGGENEVGLQAMEVGVVERLTRRCRSR